MSNEILYAIDGEYSESIGSKLHDKEYNNAIACWCASTVAAEGDY